MTVFHRFRHECSIKLLHLLSVSRLIEIVCCEVGMEDGLLSLAVQSLQDGRNDAACAVFLHLLRILPTDDIHRRTRIIDLLTAALRDWGSDSDQLDHSGFQLLMKAYHEAVELLPSCALLINNLGGLLFRSDSSYC